jgi:putative DNA primase/helicase
VATQWQQAGVSIIPILANQTKRPAVRWGDFQVQVPTLSQVEEWWGNGKPYGLAVICGAVSGNLEMTEIEGRACDGASMTSIANHMDESGIGHVWDLLTGPNGYSEMSPSGGIHLLYRISDHEVPGNTKIAANTDQLVLAETRGEGGYVIVAPTSGVCHPSGEAWELINGIYGTLPLITWEQRCKLHEALHLALDTTTPQASSTRTLTDETAQIPAVLPARPIAGSSTAGLSPGDHFEATTDWAEILEPHGWLLESRRGPVRNWTRPGKDRRGGSSATTGASADRDRLYVFSTSTIFVAEEPYTKFAAHALLNFGGDYSAAASDLRRRGYGAVAPELPTLRRELADSPRYEMNDDGNAQYLRDRIQGTYHYLAEEKTFICWDGRKWITDQRFAVAHEFSLLVQEKLNQARQLDDEVAIKWWVRAGNKARADAAVSKVRELPGFTVLASELNLDKRLINVENGVLDLVTQQLAPHDPNQKMTRIMGAAFEPGAACPRFEEFMERVLPEEAMRSYVQRALGYSLLGEADQRSLFLVCGPSGTGKSTLMSAMEMIFGDYATSAPSGTLRAAGRETSSPSNDLHTLRGKRFVSTSETNEHTAYNEDLIKRLTGRDKIQSRRLYQDFQEWSPQCVIWLATNHAPKFNSDDDAIWRRAKIVPFNTVLLGEGQISDFAHNVLTEERNGILNWLLAGLRDYQSNGLGEPEEVKDSVREMRLSSDSVARFLEDRLSDGVLTRGELHQMRTMELYAMYTEWARQVGERSLGSRRFINRIVANYRDLSQIRIGGNSFVQGVGRVNGAGILGLMPPPD